MSFKKKQKTFYYLEHFLCLMIRIRYFLHYIFYLFMIIENARKSPIISSEVINTFSRILIHMFLSLFSIKFILSLGLKKMHAVIRDPTVTSRIFLLCRNCSFLLEVLCLSNFCCR